MELSFNINLDDDNYGRIYVTSVENLNKIVECFRKTCEGMTCISEAQIESEIKPTAKLCRSVDDEAVKIGPVKFNDGKIGYFYVKIGDLRTQSMTWKDAVNSCELSEFRLPTKEELDLIIKHKDLIDSVDPSEKGTFSYIDKDWIWSSSEYSSNLAWVQRPSDGVQDGGNKGTDYWVVPFMRVTY